MTDPKPTPETLFDEFLWLQGEDTALQFDDWVKQYPSCEASLRELRSEDQRLVGEVSQILPPMDSGGQAWSTGDRIDIGDLSTWRTAAMRNVVGALIERRSGGLSHELLERFSKGGMGELRLGWDPVLHRQVAVKRILPKHQKSTTDAGSARFEQIAGRFLAEAQVMAQLAHPGIIPIHELGIDDDNQLFLSMPKVEGVTLGEVFELVGQEREGRTRLQALSYLLRVVETVGFAHSKGIVHRDLKPDNVMVGEHGEVYVMDWGIATTLGTASETDIKTLRDGLSPEDSPIATMQGQGMGTLPYMAPEVLEGQNSSIAADIYALGAMLYELLSGMRPFEEQGSPAKVLEALRKQGPTPLSQVSKESTPELDSIASKAMDRRVEVRYKNCDELATDIQAYLEGRVVSAHERGPWPELRKWILRNKAVAATIVMGVLLAIGAIVARAEIRSTVAAGEKASIEQELAARDRLLGEQAFSSAKSNMFTGNFDLALEQLSIADEFSGEDSVALDLMRIDCLTSKQNFKAAWAVISKLSEGDKDGSKVLSRSQKGRLLMRQATTSWAGVVLESVDRESIARNAIEHGLPPGELEFAEALLAEHTADALLLLEESLSLVPFNRIAHEEYVALLLFMGDEEKLRAEAHFFERLYPGSVGPGVALAFGAVLAADEAGLDRELAALEGRMAADEHEAICKVFSTVLDARELIDGDAVLGAVSPIKIASTLTKLLMLKSECIDLMGSEWNPFANGPGLKSTRNVLACIAGLLPESIPDPNDIREVSKFISNATSSADKIFAAGAQASQFHNDAFFSYCRVMKDIMEDKSSGKEAVRAAALLMVSKLDPIEHEFSILGGYARGAAFHALSLQSTLYTVEPTEELQRDIQDRFDRYLVADDLGPRTEIPQLIGLAAQAKLWPVVIELCDRRVRGKRKPPKNVLITKLGALQKLKRFSEAKEILDYFAGIRRKPKNLDQLVAAWQKDMDDWNSSILSQAKTE